MVKTFNGEKLVKRLISEGLVVRVDGKQDAYAVAKPGKIVLKLCRLVRHG